MRVKEIIQNLSKYNGDSEVFVFVDDLGENFIIEFLDTDDDGNIYLNATESVE